ncbi:hypothetical protein AB0I28_19725 [Phytomonospora sp. NPDC050363]|uniref:hypothetical protein n=1 Tax=Phytomonospora sp. NPDC050363 TaxID=3155642 RepID=UPI003408E312
MSMTEAALAATTQAVQKAADAAQACHDAHGPLDELRSTVETIGNSQWTTQANQVQELVIEATSMLREVDVKLREAESNLHALRGG